MNHWSHLIGAPQIPEGIVPKEKDRHMETRRELRTAAGGRVHLIGDEAETAAARPDPAPWKPVRAKKPSPAVAAALLAFPEAKIKPDPLPGPKAYRIPATKPTVELSYGEAIAIRERARMRQPVDADLVTAANFVVGETRRRAREKQE